MPADQNELALRAPRTVVRITARLNVGGIARHVAWLSAGLEEEGFRTTLVCGTVPEGEDDMSEFACSQGVRPLMLRQMSREISPSDFVTVIQLVRLFSKVRPDIIHTHSAKAGAVGRLAAWLYRWLTPGMLLGRPRRCRVLHTYHGHVFHSYFGHLKTRFFLTIERTLSRLVTDRIVVISRQQYREIHETFRVGRAEQFAVVPLGIDLAPYERWRQRRATLRHELGAADDEVLVGIVGRLTEIKNHAMFLRVARACLDQSTLPAGRLRFVVIGDGHLRGRLEEQARSLGLGSSLVFLGNRKDPEHFYPGLDIVALTSLNEGTPLTLIEAMANGRPVISTAVGGVVDLLGEPSASAAGLDRCAICQRGLRVASGDDEGFASGLSHLISDSALRRDLGASGEQFIQANYSKERLLADMASLYEELLRDDVTAPHDQAPLTVDSGKQVMQCAS